MRSFGGSPPRTAGYTERVVISVIDDYAKTRRRLGHLDDETPQPKERHRRHAEFGAR